MVKTKKINNFTLYLLAFLCLFFVGCDLSSFIPSLDGGEITPTYSIETPSYLKIITTDDSTLTYYTRYDNLALIVNDNPDANGYAFYVYGGNGDYNNLSLYTRFVTEKNYYELKNVFGEEEGKIPYTQKRYYFYAIALGGEIDGITYKDSANSPIKFIDFKKELETPILSLNPRTKILGWQNISDTEFFEIWEGENPKDLQTFTRITTLAGNVFEYDFNDYYQTKKRNLNFMVRAIADTNTYFINSYFSNSITFDSSLTLYNPINLVINDYTLTWEEVENADSYIVVIDDTLQYPVSQTTFDLSVISSIPGNHSITVKSVTANPNIDLDNEITTVYKAVYIQLNNPTNIKVSQVDNFVKVSFDAVENALTYYITVNGQTLFTALTQTSFDYDVKDNYELDNTLKFTIMANDNGFFTQSSAIESQSFRFTQFLKTPIIKGITTNRNGDKIMTLEVTKIDTNIKINLQDSIHLDIEIKEPSTSVTVLLTDYLEDNGEYNITVQSIAYNNNYLKDSDISPIFKYINNVPFSAPQILDIKTSSNGAYINVSWTPIPNVVSYRLYVNDSLYITTPMTQYQVSKLEITELLEGGYNFNVQAVGVEGSYTDSVLGENTYYKGYDGLDKVSGISIVNTSKGFNVSWRAVEYAESYTVFVNNEQYSITQTNFDYTTDEERPFQVIIKACSSVEEDSSYSSKVMHNTTKVNLTGYTNKYVYFNGWHDFYIKSIDEFNIICKYSCYSYKPINIFVDESTHITASNFIEIYKTAMKDFGTSSLSISYPYTVTNLNGVSGTIFDLSLVYLENTEKPALTSTNSAYQTFESQAYYKLNNPTRDSNYNDFAVEKSMIEVEVSNTNELYIAIEGGAKPIFTQNNYEAEICYLTAKEILRNIISDDMNDFEKSLAIYDYINYISVYDSNYMNGIMNDRRYWLNGPLLGGVGVCDGLSKLYSLLANLEGLKTTRITGYCLSDSGLEKLENNQTILESDKVGHAWNKTFIDADGDGNKEWYNLDLTWDGGFLILGKNNEVYELLSHRYFLLSDSQFTNHYAYIDKNVAENDFNYYDHFNVDSKGNDLYITSIDELVDYLKVLRDNESSYNGIDIKIDINNYNLEDALTMARYLSGIGFSYFADEDGMTCFIFKTI